MPYDPFAKFRTNAIFDVIDSWGTGAQSTATVPSIDDWIRNFKPLPVGDAPAEDSVLVDPRTNMERDYPKGAFASKLNPAYSLETNGQESSRLAGEYASAKADTLAPSMGTAVPYLTPALRGLVGAARGTQQALALPLNWMTGLDVSGAVLDDQRAYDVASSRTRSSDESTGEEFVRNVSQGVAEIAGLGKVLKAYGLGAKAYMAMIGARTYDSSLKQADEAGLEGADKHSFATVNAVAEVATEVAGRLLGVGALRKVFPNAKPVLTGTFTELLKTGGGEAVEEGLTQFVQNANEVYHKMRDPSQIMEGVGMAAAVGGAVGSAIGAPDAYRSRGLRREVAEQRLAEQQKLLDANARNVPLDKWKAADDFEQSQETVIKQRAAEWIASSNPEAIDRLADVDNPSRSAFAAAAGIDRSKAPGNSALRSEIVLAAREWRNTPRALPGWQGRDATDRSMELRDVAKANDLDPHELQSRVDQDLQEATTEWEMRRQVQDAVSRKFGSLSPSERKQLQEGDQDSVGRLGRFDEFMASGEFGPETGITEDLVKDVMVNGAGPKPVVNRDRIESVARSLEPRSARQGEPEATGEFTIPSLDEMRQQRDAAKEREANIDEWVLGPERAQEWKLAHQRSNSSDPRKAADGDAAVKRIEATLTKQQLDHLYGVGETGPSHDDLREYVRRLEQIGGDNPQELAESLRWAVTKLPSEKDPSKWTMPEQIAIGQMRRAYEWAQKEGWDTGDLSQRIYKAAASRFSDPEDARYILERIAPKAAAPRQSAQRANTQGEADDSTAPDNVPTEVAPGVAFSPGQPSQLATDIADKAVRMNANIHAIAREMGHPLIKDKGLLKAVMAEYDRLKQQGKPAPSEARAKAQAASAAQHDVETLYRSIPGSNLPELMRKIEPGADRGALVSFRELRKASSLDKKSFDTIAMELSRRGVISLHRNDYVAPLSAEELAATHVFVPGEGDGGTGNHPKGTYYIGAAIRQSSNGGAHASPAIEAAPRKSRGLRREVEEQRAAGLFPSGQIDTQHPPEFGERIAPGNDTSSVSQVVQAANALVKAVSGRDVVSRLGRLPKSTPGGQPVAGVSKTHAGVRRRRSYTSLPVEFHEAGHQLYRALNRDLAADPNVRAIAAELMKMGKNLYGDEQPAAGYDGEGFSEFQALVNTNVAKAKKHMPATLAWWDAYVQKHPKVAKAAAEARRLGHLWYAQGMLGRADAQRVTPAEQRKDKRRAMLQRVLSPDHFRKWFTNATHFTTTWATNEAERKIGRKLRPADSPDFIGTLGTGTSSGIAQHFILNGTINPDESLNGPETSLKAAVAPLKSIDPKRMLDLFGRKLNAKELQRLFDFYRKAKRTIALQTADNPRETGMSLDDAQWFTEKVDREFPQFAQAHRAVNTWWDSFMQYSTSKDPLYAKLYAEIRSKDPGEYSPLQRFFSESEGDTKQLAAAVRSRAQWGTIGGRLKGSGRPTKDILAQMAIQADAITRQVAQRQVLESLARLRDVTPDFGNVMEKVPAGKIPQAHNVRTLLERIERELQQANPDAQVEVSGMDPKELSQAILTLFTDQYRPGGMDPIYPRIDSAGQLEWNHVNPEVLKGLEGFDEAQIRSLGPVGKASARLTQLVKAGAVGATNVSWILKNAAVDFPSYLFNSQAQSLGPKLMSNWLRSLYHAAIGQRSPYVRRLSAMGLERTGRLTDESRAPEHLIREVMETPGERFLDPSVAWEKFKDVAQITERVSRIAEMMNVLEEKGIEDPEAAMTPDEHAYLAKAVKSVTGDYTRQGIVPRWLGLHVPFAGVGIVHMRSAAKAAAQSVGAVVEGKPDRRAVRRAMMILGLAGAALSLWYKNKDEEWWKEQTDEEKANWLRLNKDGFRIPIGTEIGALGVGLPIALAESIEKGESDSAREWLYSFIEQLSPISRQRMPPLFKAALEEAGMKTPVGPVVPEYMKGKPAVEQAKPHTTAAAKAIGSAVGAVAGDTPLASPVRIEHTADSLTGGAFSRLAGGAERVVTGRQGEASDTPLVGQFVDRDAGSKSEQTFYDRIEAMRTRSQSRERPETAGERETRLQMEDAAHAMGAIRRSLRETTDPKQLQELRGRIREIAREANDFDQAGRIDRAHFAVMRQVEDYWAESDPVKRIQTVMNKLDTLGRIRPFLGHAGVTRANLAAKRAAYEADTNAAKDFLLQTKIDRRQVFDLYRASVISGMKPGEARSRKLSEVRRELGL